MNEIEKRLSGLSPEKRKLLEALAAKQGLQLADQVEPLAGPLESAPIDPVRQRDNFDNSAASPLEQPLAALPENPSPQEVKSFYKGVYNEISRQLNATPFGHHAIFCNFGYVKDGSPSYSIVHLPERLLNKNTIQLVLEVVGDCPLSGCRTLDVGCGRGGTVWVITNYFDANRKVGLDLSIGAVQSCRKNHVYESVSFLNGDAESLPFKDESFDVVTNLESSHSYPSLSLFYKEVSRVLRVGGHFLYTDVFPHDRWQINREWLRECGLSCERDRDITNNVLLSCDETAGQKLAAYCAVNDRAFMNNFLGTPESEVYWRMKTGEWSYRILKSRKTEAPVNTRSEGAGDERSSP